MSDPCHRNSYWNADDRHGHHGVSCSHIARSFELGLRAVLEVGLGCRYWLVLTCGHSWWGYNCLDVYLRVEVALSLSCLVPAALLLPGRISPDLSFQIQEATPSKI